jgi:hypothetical protein
MIQTPGAGAALLSEAAGFYSREEVVVAAGQNLAANAVIGQVTATATTVVAAAGNTGNGTVGTITLQAGVREGTYKVVFIEAAANAGKYELRRPDGTLVGVGTVGGAFAAGELAFTIADGSTDFAAGDSFDIIVHASSVVAVAGNTGNGTVTLLGTSPGATPGVYKLRCTAAATNGGTFSVEDPKGVALGSATVGTTWNGEIAFRINDGSADFAVGDGFDVTVTRGQVAAWNPLGTNGTAQAYGVLWDAVDATAAAAAGAAVVRDAEIRIAALSWLAGMSEANKAVGVAQLAKRGLLGR